MRNVYHHLQFPRAPKSTTRQQKNSDMQCQRYANAQSNKGEKEKELGPEIPQAANAICHFDLRLQFCNRCQTNSGLTSDKQNFPMRMKKFHVFLLQSRTARRRGTWRRRRLDLRTRRSRWSGSWGGWASTSASTTPTSHSTPCHSITTR